MGKVKNLWEDQQEARLAEIETELMAERGWHKRDHHDQITELAWEQLQEENGELYNDKCTI